MQRKRRLATTLKAEARVGFDCKIYKFWTKPPKKREFIFSYISLSKTFDIQSNAVKSINEYEFVVLPLQHNLFYLLLFGEKMMAYHLIFSSNKCTK